VCPALLVSIGVLLGAAQAMDALQERTAKAFDDTNLS
jgi:hypothetical protein